ncbi:MAG: putative sulfate exporter family transporter [Hyphomicrobiales bacterium]
MSISITADERFSLPRPFVELLPGIALLFVIGFLGKLIENSIDVYGKTHHLALPKIEYVLWAILIGLIIANTVGVPRIFRAGVDTYEFWLKIGIVLLGVRFLLGDVLKLGGISLFAVIMELIIAIGLMLWLGNLFKLSPKLTSLLAIGSSICGVSAIIAGRGAINARDEDASFAIAAILALGAFGLFTYPLIAAALGMNDHAYGLWVGLAIDNTAEAAAAGALWSDEAGKVAVLAKTTRNAMIGFVVLGFALYWATRGQAAKIENKALFLWEKFPKFVLGFLIVSLAATFGAFSKEQSADIANLSRWAFLLTFAGVGLRTDFREMRKQGFYPFVVGAIAEIVVTVATLVMVLLLQPWLPA